MYKVAVIVCNYNKIDYVLKCVESLKRQTYSGFDIFVVDNASTDGSAEIIKQKFYDSVNLIANTENLGGSGGFNTGLRIAMNQEYQYMILLDNDVVLKEDCIETLINDMDANPEIGIMGAMILKMDMPNIIQEFGPTINYRTMTFELNHGGEKDLNTLEHICECDYVPACALIVRRNVIEKIGYMPQDFFVYYDDIMWATRCKRVGYKVVANSRAKAWHKGGAKINPTTFSVYYLTRNKLVFFMSNADISGMGSPDCIDEYIELILWEIFQGLFTCTNFGMENIAKTRFEALLDALAGKLGRSSAKSIRKREFVKERFYNILKGKKSILIYANGYVENVRRILTDIQQLEIENGIQYNIDIADQTITGLMIVNHKVVDKPSMPEDKYDVVFKVCSHICNLKVDCLDAIWIDGWANIIRDNKDFKLLEYRDMEFSRFKFFFFDRVKEKIYELMEHEKNRIIC